MQHDVRGYLWHVLDAADDIERFLTGVDEAAYADSALVHSAVERKFEIIGEAMNQLSKTAPDLARRVPHLHEIVAFRNRLIHGYANVDRNRVYQIARSALPELKLEVRRLMAEIDPDAGP